MPSNELEFSDTAHAYDMCANLYDNWEWQKVWSLIEWPLIEKEFNHYYDTHKTHENPVAVLDIGVGTGNHLVKLSRTFHNINLFGLDQSEGMLKVARSKLDDDIILTFDDITDETLESRSIYKSESMDFVLLCRALSNIQNIDILLLRISKYLKIGGKLIISDIHPLHNYQHTRVPTSKGKVSIKTYKRKSSEIAEAANKHSLEYVASASKIIKYSDLRFLKNSNIPLSVDISTSKPLSFFLIFKKV